MNKKILEISYEKNINKKITKISKLLNDDLAIGEKFLSGNGLEALVKFDESHIEDSGYMGFGRFWYLESKYNSLLELSPFSTRLWIHRQLLQMGDIEFDKYNYDYKSTFSTPEAKEEFDSKVEWILKNTVLKCYSYKKNNKSVLSSTLK